MRYMNEFIFKSACMADKTCGGQTKRGGQCRRPASHGKDRCCQHMSEQCSICFSQMTPATTRLLECGHSFHTRCIDRWKRTSRTCPICRQPFDQPVYKVAITIQCIADNQQATDTYTTSNIQSIIDGFGLDPSLLSTSRRTLTDITFDVEFGEILSEVLRDLGITRFNVPNLDAVNPA